MVVVLVVVVVVVVVVIVVVVAVVVVVVVVVVFNDDITTDLSVCHYIEVYLLIIRHTPAPSSPSPMSIQSQ